MPVSFWNNVFARSAKTPLQAAVSAEREERGLSVSTEETDPKIWAALGFAGAAVAGASVNQDSALSFAAVWACVQAIAQDLGALPFPVFSDMDGKKLKLTGHPVSGVLNLKANAKQTAYQFRVGLLISALLRGEGFALIERDGRQSVVGLHFKKYQDTEVLDYDGRFWYRFSGDKTVYADYQVIHLRNMSLDGGRGISVLHAHRKTIGLGLANRDYGIDFYENGAHLDGVLKHPGKFKDEAAAMRLRNQFAANYSGVGKKRVLTLEEGMEYQSISMPPQDAEFLNTHKLSRAEIASIFRVPPHKIGDMDSSIKANIEQQSIDYVQNTLQPWAVNIEQEFRLKLFRASEQPTTYCRHNFNGLLRGDLAARGSFYREMVNIGVYSPNEVRGLEEENAFEGGDEHFIQGAMVPLSRINDIVDKQVTPANPPVTTSQPNEQDPTTA